MNEILKKACEELAKEKPDIAYVRGMLETLLSLTEHDRKQVSIPAGTALVNVAGSITKMKPGDILPVGDDEAKMMDASIAGLVGKLPPPEMS